MCCGFTLTIHADVFVATAADASEYAQARRNGRYRLNERYQRVEFTGLTGLEFCALWAILEDEPRDARRHVLQSIAVGDDGHSWLDRFPEPLVARLAGMDASAIANAHALWQVSEGLRDADSPDHPLLLAELKRLAFSAQASGRGVYLWGSL
jgi:hypothetical protein